MPNPVLDALKAEVSETTGIIASAIVLINGIGARVQAAVDAALANGATEAELAPLTDVVAELNASSEGLAAAVAANQ